LAPILGGPKCYLAWSYLCCKVTAAGYRVEELQRFRPYLETHWNFKIPIHQHPLQRPRNYFPGLSANALHNAADFPWTATLEEAYPVIREEMLAARGRARKHQQNLVDQGSWNVLYFYSSGRRVDEAHELCPQTSAILRSIPGLGDAGQVYFSIHSPGTHVTPHCGTTNTRLRCHLGLVIPDGCRIRIGTEIVRWQEGRCLIFDDSFEHEVWHDGDRDRVVLILDVWHPELRPSETWAIHELIKLSRKDRRYWRRAGGTSHGVLSRWVGRPEDS
jgi:aspartate beta-hydroxylase